MCCDKLFVCMLFDIEIIFLKCAKLKPTNDKKKNNNHDNQIRTAITISGIIGGLVILCLAIGYYCKYKRMRDGVNANVNVNASFLDKIENEKNGDFETQLQ